jgi:hypothetical protein
MPARPGLGVTFNPFLFASVSDDPEVPLSVASALARLDLDPWQEAEELSHLQEEAAAQRLAALLAKSPGASADPRILVTQLVALLPRPPKTVTAAPGGGRFDADMTIDPKVVAVLFLVAGVVFMSVLKANEGHRSSAASDHGATSPAASSPPPNASQ